jgi:hypothetical protein
MSSITGVSHSNNLQDNNGYYDPATASPNNSKKRKQQCQYPVTQSNESPLGLSFSAYPPPSRWDTYSNTPSNMYAPTTSVPLEYPPQEPHHHPTSTHSSEPGWPHHSLDDLPHTPLPSASPNNDEHSLFENMHSTMMTPPNNAEKTAASSYPQFMHNELSTGTFSVPPPPQLSNPMEPRDINDIHHMLELDPFSSPDYRNEQGRHPRLHLQNINTAPPRQSSSPSQQSSFSPGTPGFFTPGFLGALQEDEETTFPAAGWNPAHYQGDPDSMMVREKHLIHYSFRNSRKKNFFFTDSPLRRKCLDHNTLDHLTHHLVNHFHFQNYNRKVYLSIHHRI